METHAPRHSLLRSREGHGHAAVGFVELFFDLVFVFAITQLSHALLKNYTLLGAAQTGFLLLAVWWVWIFTSWVTNWLDPERPPVQLALMLLMLMGLFLSTSLPQAFDAGGPAFAAAYVAMQVGRTLFTLWAVGPRASALSRNFQRILVWLALSGALWIGGAFLQGWARAAVWIAALAIEYLSPAVGFWVPGLGRSQTRDWNVEGHHMAERCGLFIIIALGESILVTGATFGELPWNSATLAAFAIAFAGSVLMWWIYFGSAAGAARETITSSSDPGRLARLGYTYVHLLIVFGIILSAVADELLLAHPTGHADLKLVTATTGGYVLFLGGNALFKRVVSGRWPLAHLAGGGALIVLALASDVLSPLPYAGCAVLILLAVAVAHALSSRRRA